MIDLPSTTLFNKKVKKELFYEKLNITPAIKQAFRGTDQSHLLEE